MDSSSPPLSTEPLDLSGVERFLRVVRALRDPVNGCPWDLAQTHDSLEKYFHEELHEFFDALHQRGPTHPSTWEELGDVLLQVALHAELARERGVSDFNQICARAADKFIARHPHVFDPAFPRFRTADEVSAAWEQIKAHARASASAAGAAPKSSAMPREQISPKPTPHALGVGEVPRGLATLRRAARMGEKAASVGFDWSSAAQVWEKVREEVGEFEVEAARTNHGAQTKADELAPSGAAEIAPSGAAEIAPSGAAEIEVREREELGDMLFATAQYARKRGWDPEQILDAANEKFAARFAALAARLESKNLRWREVSAEELEAHWRAIK